MTAEEFISENARADIRTLALKYAGHTDFDLNYALDQIGGRQRARLKLPSWAATDGIIYPPHLSIEQCSSELTALYKAETAERLTARIRQECRERGHGAPSMADLTGGFGVDFSYMARRFGRAVYVERQADLCGIARHNMALLGLDRAEIVCGDGAEYIRRAGHFSLVYADPARRDGHGGRTFAISDCTPDVTELKDIMPDKADFVMIKLSPMLDWRKAAADMGRQVSEVHIVSAGNECKELLLVMSAEAVGQLMIYCANDGVTVAMTAEEAAQNPTAGLGADVLTAAAGTADGARRLYLYEPDASLMKAGCYGVIERRYGVSQISAMSHVFVSRQRVEPFPGRRFAVSAVTTMNRRELKRALAGIGQANISVRNFPLSADSLRKRLRMRDGGDTYIFGTTSADGCHLLMVCSKD